MPKTINSTRSKIQEGRERRRRTAVIDEGRHENSETDDDENPRPESWNPAERANRSANTTTENAEERMRGRRVKSIWEQKPHEAGQKRRGGRRMRKGNEWEMRWGVWKVFILGKQETEVSSTATLPLCLRHRMLRAMNPSSKPAFTNQYQEPLFLLLLSHLFFFFQKRFNFTIVFCGTEFPYYVYVDIVDLLLYLTLIHDHFGTSFPYWGAFQKKKKGAF